jgi:hypothetical protein
LQPALATTGPTTTPAAAARALERAVTNAVLAGLLDARLDPRARAVHIAGPTPALRDVPPGALRGAARDLEAWAGRCDGALEECARREEEVRVRARERGLRDGRVRGLFEAKVAALGGAAAGAGNGEAGVSGGLSPGEGGDGKKRAFGVEGKEAKKMAKREPTAQGDLMELDGKGAKRPHLGSGKRAG